MTEKTSSAEHPFIKKTWGYECWIVNKPEYCGKLLHIDAGKYGSLHYHLKKDETFYLRSGEVVIKMLDKQANDVSVRLWPGDSLHIPPGQIHQIIGVEDSDLFEFSTTHEDSDSYRVQKGS